MGSYARKDLDASTGIPYRLVEYSDPKRLPVLCGRHLGRVRDLWGSLVPDADKERRTQTILAEAASCRVCSELRAQREREQELQLHPDPKMLPRGRKVGRIPEPLWGELQRIPRASEYTYPCAAETFDGTLWPRVLFAEKETYHKHFERTYGMDDPFLDVESVKAVKASPSKMPVAIERRMYHHGETRMGGFVVTFTLRDGKRYVYSGGDFCEFVSVPEGYGVEDIVDVEFEGYPRMNLGEIKWVESPDWKWCIFEPPETRK